jgi:hypothetical protein
MPERSSSSVTNVTTKREEAPDFRTISEFRHRHLAALSGLFVQVLKLCEQAGLVRLGHVTLMSALTATRLPDIATCHSLVAAPLPRRLALVTRYLVCAAAPR